MLIEVVNVSYDALLEFFLETTRICPGGAWALPASRSIPQAG
jgi:hypothetical protein